MGRVPLPLPLPLLEEEEEADASECCRAVDSAPVKAVRERPTEVRM